MVLLFHHADAGCDVLRHHAGDVPLLVEIPPLDIHLLLLRQPRRPRREICHALASCLEMSLPVQECLDVSEASGGLLTRVHGVLQRKSRKPSAAIPRLGGSIVLPRAGTWCSTPAATGAERKPAVEPHNGCVPASSS